MFRRPEIATTRLLKRILDVLAGRTFHGHRRCVGEDHTLPTARGCSLSIAAGAWPAPPDVVHAAVRSVVGELGSAWYIPTLIVPALFITHAMIFAMLARRSQ